MVRHRRFRCEGCNSTFCGNTGTPYHKLHVTRTTFDKVAVLAVEGTGISAIGRVVGHSWNTVARWLESARAAAARFNERHLRGYELVELQVDEIRAAMPKRCGEIWAFAAIEVSSRLWPATIVGRRTSENTRRLLSTVATMVEFMTPPLITSDGFKYYKSAIRGVFNNFCVYGQIIKTRRKGTTRRRKWQMQVERRLMIGCDDALRTALRESEDSEKLNTSFVERLNLTIRAATAYLTRRALTYARLPEKLAGALELVRCHYNFLRPHSALRFGLETKTPAMASPCILHSRRTSSVLEVAGWV